LTGREHHGSAGYQNHVWARPVPRGAPAVPVNWRSESLLLAGRNIFAAVNVEISSRLICWPSSLPSAPSRLRRRQLTPNRPILPCSRQGNRDGRWRRRGIVGRDRAARPRGIATCTSLNTERAYHIRPRPIIDFPLVGPACPCSSGGVVHRCPPGCRPRCSQSRRQYKFTGAGRGGFRDCASGRDSYEPIISLAPTALRTGDQRAIRYMV
jgi:hypothetical protein